MSELGFNIEYRASEYQLGKNRVAKLLMWLKLKERLKKNVEMNYEIMIMKVYVDWCSVDEDYKFDKWPTIRSLFDS